MYNRAMRRLSLTIFSLFLWLLLAFPIVAQEPATDSAQTATTAGSLQIEQVTKEDITERTSPIKGRLEGYLDEKLPGELTWHNFLQHGIRTAVDQGVSPNTIVLVLLFPLVAGLIAASRHLIGLTGFGIFVPAMLAVALLATGIRVGLILFIVIWLAATVARFITKRLKLQYLPRMALLMWLVSVGVLAVMVGGVNLGFGSVSAVSIFPILILMLLTENFIEVQTGKSMREAIAVTLQTMVMAVVAAGLMRLDLVQKTVLLYPEISLASIALFDVYVGKYVGLRALEWAKFRKIVK